MKSIFMSKTFWANILSVVAALLGAFSIGEISAEEQAMVVAGIMAVVNIAMRLITKEPVSVTGK